MFASSESSEKNVYFSLYDLILAIQIDESTLLWCEGKCIRILPRLLHMVRYDTRLLMQRGHRTDNPRQLKIIKY